MAPLKLSILTPVLNGEAFIKGCLESVIKQNCQEIEHVICDGGSTDNTCAIIQDYAKEHPHIRLESQKDSGQSEAMNRAIHLAQAPVIGFLNVDDFYEPGVLKRAIKIFENTPEPTLAMGNCRMIGDNDTLLQVNKPQARDQIDILKNKSVPYNPAAYFYHKSIHEAIGNYDDKDHYVMDLDFLLRAFEVANILYFDETWGNFRFIKGRKTFDDYHDGNMWDRRNALLQKYLKKLPLVKQIEIQAHQKAAHLWNRVKNKLHLS